MCNWAYWGIFLAWTLMVWNWVRLYRLLKKATDDYDELAEVTDDLLKFVQSRAFRRWN